MGVIDSNSDLPLNQCSARNHILTKTISIISVIIISGIVIISLISKYPHLYQPNHEL